MVEPQPQPANTQMPASPGNPLSLLPPWSAAPTAMGASSAGLVPTAPTALRHPQDLQALPGVVPTSMTTSLSHASLQLHM